MLATTRRSVRRYGYRNATVDSVRAHGGRQQILRKDHTIVAQHVAKEPRSVAARTRSVSPPRVRRARRAARCRAWLRSNRHDVSALMKSVQPAASGMIDARHGVDAMTLVSSRVDVTRDSRFGQFPVQRDHPRAMKKHRWGRQSHQRLRSRT
ncbi:hypothetical protein [Burkholderia lata]|uniref:hypothetical protein n=1 Tax=Burkholderia lata (strain ATCC 17760 / DSM 23089 / LMG 22485 / NCIMB 9086 / R18194 / 383) TaxID=482957 RepID=UPI002431006E|nr:hypothetical protein [Burkholderia lata]